MSDSSTYYYRPSSSGYTPGQNVLWALLIIVSAAIKLSCYLMFKKRVCCSSHDERPLPVYISPGSPGGAIPLPPPPPGYIRPVYVPAGPIEPPPPTSHTNAVLLNPGELNASSTAHSPAPDSTTVPYLAPPPSYCEATAMCPVPPATRAEPGGAQPECKTKHLLD